MKNIEATQISLNIKSMDAVINNDFQESLLDFCKQIALKKEIDGGFIEAESFAFTAQEIILKNVVINIILNNKNLESVEAKSKSIEFKNIVQTNSKNRASFRIA